VDESRLSVEKVIKGRMLTGDDVDDREIASQADIRTVFPETVVRRVRGDYHCGQCVSTNSGVRHGTWLQDGMDP